MANQVEQAQCNSCNGTGEGSSCSSCSGNGKIGRWKAIIGQGNQWVVEICTRCGGKGRAPCSPCNGRGWVPKVSEPPTAVKSDSSDPLVGRWETDGAYWDITYNDGAYDLVEIGTKLGGMRTGSGKAWIINGRIGVEMQSALLGR